MARFIKMKEQAAEELKNKKNKKKIQKKRIDNEDKPGESFVELESIKSKIFSCRKLQKQTEK